MKRRPLLILALHLPLAAESLTLAWRDNSDNETGFRIERSLDGRAWVEIARTPANTKGYIDTGLAPATEYTYRVRAVNAAGFSGYTNTARGTTPRADPAPDPDPEPTPDRHRTRTKTPQRSRILTFE